VLNRRKIIVVTTDLLTEGIHFNLMYVPMKHLGYKSVMVNLSDVAAMNAIPNKLLFAGHFVEILGRSLKSFTKGFIWLAKKRGRFGWWRHHFVVNGAYH
jgi:thiamine monophosphate kinase